jgi:RimJ/RimL family protein N-acetyltransferase
MPDVRLERIAPRHADAVQDLASHPDVLATTNLPEPYPAGGAITWIEAAQERREEGTEFPFAILNENDTLVGVTWLRPRPTTGPKWASGSASPTGTRAMRRQERATSSRLRLTSWG